MRLKIVFWTIVSAWLATLIALPSGLDAGANGTDLEEFTFGRNDRMRVGFDGHTVVVEIKPRPGDGLYRFASWTMKDWRNHFQKIRQFNHNRPLQRDQFVRFPFRYLKDNIQGIALQAVFHNDSSEENGWAHRVTYSGETISLISGLFATDAITPQAVLRYNDLPIKGHVLTLGQTVVIPWEWVRPGLNLFPYEVRPPLTIKKDKEGKRFAAYRIRKGESLYSAVIIRFTGRTLAEDVNELADKLMELNGISDPHRIFVGTELLIPLSWISETYLAQDIPRSTEEKEREIEAQKLRISEAEKIHVILDSGHGGKDPGAVLGSLKSRDLVFEDELVHDINLRLAGVLKTNRITVHHTLADPDQPKPVEWLNTEKDEDEKILVRPRYSIMSARTGVNMRVFLINDIYDRLLKQKIPKQNIILISVHGDALHQSLSGAMIYYADPRLRDYEFKLNRRVYRQRKEFRPSLLFPDRENRVGARLSAEFGKTIVATFHERGLRTATTTPVRGYHYRRGIKTLPAVLRYSKVPTSVLVEVANLNNTRDRSETINAAHRQKLAEGLAESIARHLRQQIETS